MHKDSVSGAQQGMRNIGISAHIDSGKTTLTERILFYCDKIHAIHEVHGKDGVGATMDSMELERERGITIASAATNVRWKQHTINIIDTPGHVDFTIEVERALRVLDGAVLVLDAVGGVQSQTITVDRQLRRYSVPSLIFVNKCDRVGADPLRARAQVEEKLGRKTALLQLPIGLEEQFEGVVDLVRMKALYFDGASGEIVREAEIPDNIRADAEKCHEELIDAASLFSDKLAESYLEGTATNEQIYSAIRGAVIEHKLTPLLVGSAYKNRGVQPLLDAIALYLPDPTQPDYHALDLDSGEQEVPLKADPALPTVALAFKLEEGQYGQLTYMRIYQGMLKKGMDVYNTRSRSKIRIGRLIRMHAQRTEDISEAGAGDIVALFGVDCTSGDTFTSPGLNYSMTSMFVPKPVISLALKPKDRASETGMSRALGRFTKEDPTFRTHVDEESKQTIVSGMGELHLDVYIERMRREYRAEIETGAPQVTYRETISRKVEFDYIHKKQTGGSGQFGRVAGFIEPLQEGDYEFTDSTKGGTIPKEYIPSCDKGFRSALQKGSLIGVQVIGIRIVVNDGASHAVDSSDIAFQLAAIGCFRQAYPKAEPRILEPIMRLVIEGPSEFQGAIFASIHQRRGIILSSSEDRLFLTIEAETPLSEMFGYSTNLRSLTQGKAEFSMEFLRYGLLPRALSDTLIEHKSQKGASKNG